MSRASGRGLLVALLLPCSAAPAWAQTGDRLAIGLSAARVEARLDGLGSGVEELSGPVFGVEARASLWWLHVRGEYREGRLERAGDGESSRVASARASVGLSPRPWLAVTFGPRIFELGSLEDDRWLVRWRLELHGSGPLLDGILDAFGSVGGSVAGTDMEWSMPLSSGGGELGVRIGGGTRPVWVTLGYRIDRETVAVGAWQAVESIHLAFGVSVPNAGG